MSDIVYKYLLNGKPLVSCPQCNGNLCENEGIAIELAVFGQNILMPSCLEDDGILVDTDDCVVARGFHSATLCGHCGEMLINMEGVEEKELEV